MNAIEAWAVVALGGLKTLRSRLHKEHAHFAAAGSSPEHCDVCGGGLRELIESGDAIVNKPRTPCEHPIDSVVANVTQADAVWRHTAGAGASDPQTYNVQWCRRCGAYRVMFGDDEFGTDRPGEWNLPDFAKAEAVVQ